MDQETFWLLMQVMFGNHHQRQKAHFKLRRKGVPHKIRLEARHKGPGARLSLKQALRDAVSKYEFEQRHSQYTASAFSTHTAKNHNYGSFDRPQSHRSLGVAPKMDPHAHMRSQGTISQYDGYTNNFAGRLQKKIDSLSFPFKLIGNSIYDTADAAYVSFFSLQRGNMRTNLAGEVVTRSQITDSGVKTLISIIPYSKLMRLKGLNVIEFSKTFKGTFITRLKPATRGFINRANNYAYKRQRGYFIKGVYSSSTAVSKGMEKNDNQ